MVKDNRSGNKEMTSYPHAFMDIRRRHPLWSLGWISVSTYPFTQLPLTGYNLHNLLSSPVSLLEVRIDFEGRANRIC